MSTPTPALPTDTPKWVSTAVKFLLVAVPTVLALWKPGHAFNSATAQAAIVSAGVVAAGLAHVVEILAENLRKFGVSKLAFENTYYQEDSWVHDNLDDLKGVAAQLEKLPDVTSIVGGVDARLKGIESKLAAIPAVDRVAIEALIREEIAKFLNSTPTTKVPTAVTISTTQGASAPLKPPTGAQAS